MITIGKRRTNAFWGISSTVLVLCATGHASRVDPMNEHLLLHPTARIQPKGTVRVGCSLPGLFSCQGSLRDRWSAHVGFLWDLNEIAGYAAGTKIGLAQHDRYQMSLSLYRIGVKDEAVSLASLVLSTGPPAYILNLAMGAAAESLLGHGSVRPYMHLGGYWRMTGFCSAMVEYYPLWWFDVLMSRESAGLAGFRLFARFASMDAAVIFARDDKEMLLLPFVSVSLHFGSPREEGKP